MATTTFIIYTVAYQGQDGNGAPGTALPLPDAAAAAVGTSPAFAHQDHVHPTNLLIYNSVTQLGLTSGSAAIAEAYAALPVNSVLITQAADFNSDGLPSTNGYVELLKSTAAARGSIRFIGKNSQTGDWTMDLTGENAPAGAWQREITLVASGTATSGYATWYYRKWSDGRVEAWGKYNATIAITTNSSAYGGYRSGEINFPLPFELGLNSANYYIVGHKAGAGGSKLNAVYPYSASAARMYFWAPISVTEPETVHAYLCGTWR